MFVLSILLLVLSKQRSDGATLNCSAAYNRLPENSDITVTCGPSSINLSIEACPAAFANFDPELLALNGKHNLSNCLGTLDTSGSTPVMKYTLPVNDMAENACGSIIQITVAPGTGEFADYSSVQSIIFSGFVDSPSLSSGGLISYSTNVYYNFSCMYPMQYLIKNTALMTSFGAVAVNSNNGSFLSTLSMTLFLDANFATPVQLNGTVYPLKTKIYVKVLATNLTSNFNVLLDQCFATPSPLVTPTVEKYSFFTGCSVANKTSIISNGIGQVAQFSFEAFRFVQHSGQKSSTSYLHCMTRLCKPDQCVSFLQGCNNTTSSSRRRREANSGRSSTTMDSTDPVTVSSGPISTKETAINPIEISSGSDNSNSNIKQLEGTLTGLIIGIVIAAILGTGLVIGSMALYKMYQLRATQAKTKA